MNRSRRTFIKNSLAAGMMIPLAGAEGFPTGMQQPEKLKVHIFSKHLQFLNYKDLANAAVEMGFDGIDLSVRPKGHVTPDRVEEDLPRAVEAMKKEGLNPALMTTAVHDAENATDRKLLSTASSLGLTHYRMNWYEFPEKKSMPDALRDLSQKINGLAEFNKQLGITGYYQNHAGISIGSVLWEVHELIKNALPSHMGVQYDIRHAMVEGAQSWEKGLQLIHDRIQSISLKDYRWTNKDGKWMVEDVPVGEGMIDFRHYFKLLKHYKINVPVSLHIEYDLGGAEKGATTITKERKEVFAAMKKDLQKINELWQQA